MGQRGELRSEGDAVKLTRLRLAHWNEIVNNWRELEGCRTWPEGHPGGRSHETSERAI